MSSNLALGTKLTEELWTSDSILALGSKQWKSCQENFRDLSRKFPGINTDSKASHKHHLYKKVIAEYPIFCWCSLLFYNIQVCHAVYQCVLHEATHPAFSRNIGWQLLEGWSRKEVLGSAGQEHHLPIILYQLTWHFGYQMLVEGTTQGYSLTK